MDKETYEALKEVVSYAERELHKKNIKKTYSMILCVNQVKDWVDEVAKDYEEDEEYQQAIQETDDYWRENRHK